MKRHRILHVSAAISEAGRQAVNAAPRGFPPPQGRSLYAGVSQTKVLLSPVCPNKHCCVSIVYPTQFCVSTMDLKNSFADYAFFATTALATQPGIGQGVYWRCLVSYVCTRHKAGPARTGTGAGLEAVQRRGSWTLGLPDGPSGVPHSEGACMHKSRTGVSQVPTSKPPVAVRYLPPTDGWPSAAVVQPPTARSAGGNSNRKGRLMQFWATDLCLCF